MSYKVRSLFISDPHGCRIEMEGLLHKVKYDPVQDQLFLLGDFINRGEDSIGCLRLVRQLVDGGALACLGNHEMHFLRWFKGSQDPSWLKTRPHYAQFDDADITFINNLPLYIKVKPDLYAIHAGILPGIPVEKQHKEDLLYLRYTDEARNTIPLKKAIVEVATTSPRFWTEFGPFGVNLVAGHCVFLDGPKITKYDDGSWVACIDTGCCFGNYLSCLIIKNSGEQEIVQVKAKKVYYQSKF